MIRYDTKIYDNDTVVVIRYDTKIYDNDTLKMTYNNYI